MSKHAQYKQRTDAGLEAALSDDAARAAATQNSEPDGEDGLPEAPETDPNNKPEKEDEMTEIIPRSNRPKRIRLV